MKVLHITPHLGGGVGKAFSGLCAASSPDIKRTFLLLESPRDRRYSDLINKTGADVISADNLTDIAALAAAADIVQFEFWNHPRTYELLAKCPFPAMRFVFWCHISGLFAPFIAPGLLTSANRFVFTSPCSFRSAFVAEIAEEDRRRLHSIGSGYGFSGIVSPKRSSGPKPKIGYLGTVDFVKMHPDFFSIVDAVDIPDLEVSVWGGFDPEGAVVKAHRAMQNPEKVKLLGHCADPEAALSELDIFLYPLHPEHYGTAENALIEAMSLGVVPLVLANPAEQAIIEHGKTGFIATDSKDCSALLGNIMNDLSLIRDVGTNASSYIHENHTSKLSAQKFQALYQDVLHEAKIKPGFVNAIGNTPKAWFLSTQSETGTAERFRTNPAASKGSIQHFLECFPDDPGLLSLK